MYAKVKYPKTSLKKYEVTEGETIEQKIERMLNNKEPITGDGNERMFQTRAEGIDPITDIRSDRFDMALDMTDKIAADKLAKRQKLMDEAKNKTDGGTQPADGQNSDPAGTETKKSN